MYTFPKLLPNAPEGSIYQTLKPQNSTSPFITILECAKTGWSEHEEEPHLGWNTALIEHNTNICSSVHLSLDEIHYATGVI